MCVSAWQGTDAEYIEAEALADGLVDKLIRQAVKAHMASQGQGPSSFILREKSHIDTQGSFSSSCSHSPLEYDKRQK